MRNVEIITHTRFSLKLFFWYIITKTVQFYNYIQFSQASITRYTTLVKVSWPEFQTSPRVEGMSEIHSKISLDRFLPFPLSVDTNHLIANDFIDFDFYLLATPGFNFTRIYTDFILKGRQVEIVKNWAPTNQKKILNLVLKKR